MRTTLAGFGQLRIFRGYLVNFDQPSSIRLSDTASRDSTRSTPGECIGRLTSYPIVVATTKG
jgi:hypothetical protein